MPTAGIIAEYNPFHLGHAWHIAETRRALGGDSPVVCVISGHWTQQAGCSVTDKWTRARMALLGGADLLLELPTPWAAASAERFARGGIEVLTAAGVVEVLSFGSEAGELRDLAATAHCLDSGDYHTQLRSQLERGVSFPAARQATANALIGPAADCLSLPNNNLGVEYLRAIRALGSPLTAMTVPRRGAGHNAAASADGFASATHIRGLLARGNWQGAEALLPPGPAALLKNAQPADLNRCQRAILARLRTMEAADWAALPDSGAAEGLPERLLRSARQAASLAEFYDTAKTKRYTHARIRRLALCAFLGLTEPLPRRVPYLRVLGFNTRGQALLKQMKARAALPIITKPAHIRALNEEAQRVFQLESRCTDLYALCLEQPWPCGREYTATPVILP